MNPATRAAQGWRSISARYTSPPMPSAEPNSRASRGRRRPAGSGRFSVRRIRASLMPLEEHGSAHSPPPPPASCPAPCAQQEQINAAIGGQHRPDDDGKQDHQGDARLGQLGVGDEARARPRLAPRPCGERDRGRAGVRSAVAVFMRPPQGEAPPWTARHWPPAAGPAPPGTLCRPGAASRPGRERSGWPRCCGVIGNDSGSW